MNRRSALLAIPTLASGLLVPPNALACWWKRHRRGVCGLPGQFVGGVPPAPVEVAASYPVSNYVASKSEFGGVVYVLIPGGSFYAPNSLVLGVYQFAALVVATDDQTAAFVNAMNFLRPTNSSLADATIGGDFAGRLYNIPGTYGEAMLFGWYNRSNEEAGWVQVQMFISTSSPVGFGFTIKSNEGKVFQPNGNQLFTVHWNDVSNNNQDIYVNISAGGDNNQLQFQFGISTIHPTGNVGRDFEQFESTNFKF
jgi:hypothetical protein